MMCASSGAVVGWLLCRLVVTSLEKVWYGNTRTQEKNSEEIIRVLEKENQALVEQNMMLAVENRLLSDRIHHVAFPDEDNDDVARDDGDDDWSWWWWEEKDSVCKTPEKNGIQLHESEQVNTPPLDSDTQAKVSTNDDEPYFQID